MSDFRKNILRKKIIVMKYPEKNCLNSKKNLLWRIILGKKNLTLVYAREKNYVTKGLGKKSHSRPLRAFHLACFAHCAHKVFI